MLTDWSFFLTDWIRYVTVSIHPCWGTLWDARRKRSTTAKMKRQYTYIYTDRLPTWQLRGLYHLVFFCLQLLFLSAAQMDIVPSLKINKGRNTAKVLKQNIKIWKLRMLTELPRQSLTYFSAYSKGFKHWILWISLKFKREMFLWPPSNFNQTTHNFTHWGFPKRGYSVLFL